MRVGMRRQRGLLAVTVAVVLALPSAGRAALTAPPVVCTSLSAASASTLFCGSQDVTGGSMVTHFYVSHDGGKSWISKRAQGVSTRFGVPPGAVVVSPRFAADHRVYWGTPSGLLVSTDEGDTFSVADAQTTFVHPDVPSLTVVPTLPALGLPVPLPDTGVDVGMLVPGKGGQSSLFVAPLERPIVASPEFDQDFLVPTDGSPVLDVAWVTESALPTEVPKRHMAIYLCDAAFSCTAQRASFAFQVGDTPVFPRRSWLSPSYAADHTLAVTTSEANTFSVWRSTDAGKTVTPWASAQAIVRAFDRSTLTSRFEFTASPAAPAQMWLRLSNATREEVWHSRDKGEHWARMAWGETVFPGYERKAGTLPWTAGTQGWASLTMLPTKAGLLAAASRQGHYSLWCSKDSGKSWRQTAC